MDKQALTLLAQVVAYGLPTLIAAIGAWRKWATPRLRPYLRGISSLGDIGEMQDDIKAIRKEVTTNGGGSLKDAVNRIEVAGRRSAAMLRSHIANIDEAQFDTDASGALTWANETLVRWTGVGLDSLQGRGWRSVIAEADQAYFLAAFDVAVRDGREFRGQCAMRVVIPPTHDEHNPVQHFPSDWRMTVVRDPLNPREIIGYSGNVRRRHATGEVPAVRPTIPLHMRQDDGA